MCCLKLSSTDNFNKNNFINVSNALAEESDLRKFNIRRLSGAKMERGLGVTTDENIFSI